MSVAARIALIGLPNCGKTALFNRLTGSHQKVANYPGVTVERKEGQFTTTTGQDYRILDLPGTYSLKPTTLDEAVTRDIALGRFAGEQRPDLIVLVADATHLPLSLRLALEVKRLGLPMVLALNMSDLAARRGFQVDRERLEQVLGIPIVEAVAVRAGGADSLIAALQTWTESTRSSEAHTTVTAVPWAEPSNDDVRRMHEEAARLLELADYREPLRSTTVANVDRLLLHPLWGMLSLALLLFLVFQAVFSWAATPMEWIDAGVGALADAVNQMMPAGPLRSLLADGVIAGVGSVIIFLPQILILFTFILILEDSGYLPRAAYLLDRVMGGVGLSGRAFIPLLSSFACAIPGIMATRTIPHWHDRLATILVAPLMTCSARLPVYALLIAAFIPDRSIGPFNLQGVVLFGLYFAGIFSALLVAYVIKLLTRAADAHLLVLELPDYQWPNLQSVLFGLWERARLFLQRAGGIILALVIVLWFLSTYPAPPPDATQPAIQYSFAGQLGMALAWVLGPIGFNWQIAIALIPGLAAREVAVGALGTVYALSGDETAVSQSLASVIASDWSLATALALLAWYVFAPQCVATLAVVKRETNSWRYPLLMALYLFALAYLAAWITYRVAVTLGAG
ncbi:MAG: ferrous iron transporter B [Gammaproteobacteria bacterium]|jgi:ferrous iron transport protein B|nr:ferrous iron transporter B [Gammaproteobacteria bacterium]